MSAIIDAAAATADKDAKSTHDATETATDTETETNLENNEGGGGLASELSQFLDRDAVVECTAQRGTRNKAACRLRVRRPRAVRSARHDRRADRRQASVRAR